jgi:hypothetical protein
MAISSVKFDVDTNLESVRKVFRKRLMTGGAVIELPINLCLEEQIKIFEICEREASERPGIARLTLVALAKHSELLPELVEKLVGLSLQDLDRVLFRREMFSKASSSIRSLERVSLSKIKYSSLNVVAKREAFLENIGSSALEVENRVALVKSGELPADLHFLFRRDPSSKVRFAARSVRLQ